MAIFVQYLAIYKMSICPIALKIPIRFKILPNTKETLKSVANDFWNSAKVAQFCQIWSHCYLRIL